MEKLVFGEHNCLECGQKLTGRWDKKFCDSQCRSTFHNRQKRGHEHTIRNTNSQLRKNRTILKTLCPTGKATVRRTVLENLGHDFSIFSGIYQSGKNRYYLSYEYGFTPIIDPKGVQKVVIIQRQDYFQFDPWNMNQ